MDYEKLYNEALKRAKKYKLKEDLIITQDIFPELKESEDERIRKKLIEFVKSRLAGFPECKRFTDWLEKQGEQKPFNYEDANIQQKDFAPKVELKFKVGDWIINRTDATIMQIVNNKDFYESVEIGGQRRTDTYNYIEWDFRLWTIQDAKDGDVLYSPCLKLLWIYNKDEKTCYVGSNLNYNSGSIVINKPVCIPTDVQPATKEQRDLLFQKMKETGYEWDAEKKELKKVEQNPAAWSEEDERNIDYIIDKLKTINDERHFVCICWLKSLKDRVQPKQEWSEEDKRKIDRIYFILRQAADTHAFSTTCRLIGDKECVELQDFLKSLKPQNRWKPSDEQMEALDEFIYTKYPNIEKYGDAVESLYQDLKKLRKK